ncbi:MAG: mannose/fructose/sorbose PTS transporter subunit IIA [Enterococcus aquimarinus]|uniref:PTS system mannose-specific EIIAB component n=1 Tax=Enterococcus aquimarinus TaxID=328396 RepID=A0A9E3ZTU0_9ENTE|nr:mannose/fructose/sorbose PTS transporter subunit IIA [Enterococcus aquimarinus]
MVGIILASHGEFANGLMQSGAMIFGEQPNVAACVLHPSEGPDDIKAKMQAAIDSFDDQTEVLFLVDLWGGTPFNQANSLFEAHKENWAIVSGMNLPMLIEAYAARLSMEKAQDVAKAILGTAKEGVKVKPEELEPEEVVVANAPAAPQGAIPAGTVLGDGEIKFVLARVDSRLLHGQVATAWTKATNPSRIIVVSDAVAKDELRRKLIEQATPPGVKANVIPIRKMIEISKDPRFGDTKALLLFENPQDVLRVVEAGVKIKEVNVGSLAHSTGKVVVSKVLSMGHEEVAAFEKLKDLGVTFDVRKVPNDSKDNLDELLKKAKKELA